MEKLPSYILISTIILIFAFMLTGIVYIWAPELVNLDLIKKVSLTYAVFVIGSIAVSKVSIALKKQHKNEDA